MLCAYKSIWPAPLRCLHVDHHRPSTFVEPALAQQPMDSPGEMAKSRKQRVAQAACRGRRRAHAGNGKHIGVMCRLGVLPAIRRLSGGARKSVSRMLASFKGLDLCSQSVRKRVSEIWWPATVLGLGSLCVVVEAAMLWNERHCRSS